MRIYKNTLSHTAILSMVLLLFISGFALASQNERESNSTKSSITNTRQNLAQNQHKQTHQKSSGFIGFELGFGLANTKISQNHQNLLSDKTYATLPLNLSFGYLWYFSRSM